MNIIERVKNIIVAPKKEWGVIAAEEGSVSSVLTTYVLPLSLIGAAATLIGWGLIGKYGKGLGYWDKICHHFPGICNCRFFNHNICCRCFGSIFWFRKKSE